MTTETTHRPRWRRSNPPREATLLVRVTAAEREELQQLADERTDGNVSQLVRTMLLTPSE